MIVLPQLVKLSLERCDITDPNVLSVPRLRHLVWLPWDWRSTAVEIQFINRVALTLVSLTTHFNDIASIPPSIYSSSVSIFFPYCKPSLVPTTFVGNVSVRINLENDKSGYSPSSLSGARGELEDWTKLVSTSNAQIEAIYLAIDTEGGGGKVHPEIKDPVKVLEAACRRKKIPVFWEEGNDENHTFTDFVPASFIEISEARVIAARGSTG